MNNFTPPLTIVFIWHPADKESNSLIAYSSSLLTKDERTPFSRSINIPIYYYTSIKKGVPSKLKDFTGKTIIFSFISKEITSDNEWSTYIENIPLYKDIFLIPIAHDRTAFCLKGSCDKKNFIRAYEFEEQYRNDYMFISIAHEIYRCSLNETYDEIALGKDNAIKLFLSHAKDGKNGIEIARALKKFIDNSSMRSFFDATDIAAGYRFDEEIIKSIKESTVIAIHSDIYSSRYWCQREILCAKQNNRPIIAVDSLEIFEDRRFPFASNIPGVHVHYDTLFSEKELLKIIRIALLETLRFYYSILLLNKYKEIGWINDKAEILARPPEVSDVEKMFYEEDDCIQYKNKLFVYPDPPVYEDEIAFLKSLNIQIETPLTTNICSLNDKKIGISIANPNEEELSVVGQTKMHLAVLSQEIARYLLSNNATLIYGGDFRKDGFTEFIYHEARVLQTRLQKKDLHLQSYIAWPIYIRNMEDEKNWKAENKDISEVMEISPPHDIIDLIPNLEYYLDPINDQNNYVWSRCLTEMREQMIKTCNVRICAGGKLSGYKGLMPGVLEEILIAAELKLPIYLLGGFGGLTSKVCEIIKTGNIPEEFTLQWQIENNAGYKKMLDFINTRNSSHTVNYPKCMDIIRNIDLRNGLSREDNVKLFNTHYIDEAVYLVLKGLKTIF